MLLQRNCLLALILIVEISLTNINWYMIWFSGGLVLQIIFYFQFIVIFFRRSQMKWKRYSSCYSFQQCGIWCCLTRNVTAINQPALPPWIVLMASSGITAIAVVLAQKVKARFVAGRITSMGSAVNGKNVLFEEEGISWIDLRSTMKWLEDVNHVSWM